MVLMSALPVSAEQFDLLGDYNTRQDLDWSFATIDGRYISSVTYGGKTQILVFFRANGWCVNSNQTIQGIAESDWVSCDNVQVIAIGCGERSDSAVTVKERTIAYKQQYAPNCDDIEFCYSTYSGLLNTMYSFQRLVKDDSIFVAYALNFVIDSEDSFRYAWLGPYNADRYTYVLSELNVDYGEGTELSNGKRFDLKVSGTYDFDSAYKLLDMVNYERDNLNSFVFNGYIDEAVMDAEIMERAMQRAAELAVYYSHFRPDGTSRDTLVGYRSLENIAVGYETVFEVMDVWKDSPGHNPMLNNTCNSAGIACFIDSSGIKYWVQLFADKEPVEEAVRSTGKQKSVRNVTVVDSLLDIELPSKSIAVGVGSSKSITAKNRNAGNPDISSEIGFTYAESSNTGIVKAEVSADSSVSVVGMSEGVSTVKLGFVSANGEKPYVFELPVTVSKYSSGDLNGDGNVNITDAIELLKYVAKLDNNIVNTAGTDIDGNGTVNINDAIALLKQIAGLH